MGNKNSSSVSESESIINASSGSQKEMVLSSTPFLPVDIICRVKTSVCKIRTEQNGEIYTGSGFFGVIRENESERFGLFTNNHMIDNLLLCSGDRFTCIVGDQEIHIQRGTYIYCFTCPLLDATFIQVTKNKRKEIENKGCTFLTTGLRDFQPSSRGDFVFILQHPKGGDLALHNGPIADLWGFDLHHKVSTERGSSGSPVFNIRGGVVGIHKSRRPQSKCNVAVQISFVVNAILKDIEKRKKKINVAEFAIPSTTADWTQPQIRQLAEIGLQHLTGCPGYNNHMFVSPAETFLGMSLITPIWFRHTFTFWYWTPTDPKDEQGDANWMRISPNDGLRVTGGFWHGKIPAEKNVRIIEYLKNLPADINGNEE